MEEISISMKLFIIGNAVFFVLLFGSRVYRFFFFFFCEKQWDREELIDKFGENYLNNPDYFEYKALMN